ncbi:conserved exported hypothetical protein [Hyphomicrobium sp. GJ21]|jgi:hypothetical protein|uniref:hypothetical protein n=1 Tax=unclassified Hyphomicrobium TaxID=2619925 RepID=UPI000622B6AA|nr:hypothetical protein [Hyphomicrobium sp. GJ21]CEJ87949.1 conserved exported hypothetical protein [Hyphomicrobium sp. GJ21]
MQMIRTLIIVVLALASAFAPVAGAAMAKPCTMATEMRAGSPTECPCHSAMKDCASLPQCRTSAGCASQCFTAGAWLPTESAFTGSAVSRERSIYEARFTSLMLKPPAPPPRG